MEEKARKVELKPSQTNLRETKVDLKDSRKRRKKVVDQTNSKERRGDRMGSQFKYNNLHNILRRIKEYRRALYWLV